MPASDNDFLFFFKQTGRLRFIIFFFEQQTRKNESIHKEDVYLVFNRPDWLLAIENINCKHVKLKAVSAQ